MDPIKATDQYFTNQKCEKCVRHPSECFVKDICKGFEDKTVAQEKKPNKFDQYDELKAVTKHTNEGFLGKA